MHGSSTKQKWFALMKKLISCTLPALEGLLATFISISRQLRFAFLPLNIFPANIYLSNINNKRNTKKGVKYFPSWLCKWLWCLNSWHWTYCPPFSNVFIIDCEQVDVFFSTDKLMFKFWSKKQAGNFSKVLVLKSGCQTNSFSGVPTITNFLTLLEKFKLGSLEWICLVRLVLHHD